MVSKEEIIEGRYLRTLSTSFGVPAGTLAQVDTVGKTREGEFCLHGSLAGYQTTDLPLDVRLYVEDIDSFRKVRDVNPATVMDTLTNGYLARSEDSIQTALSVTLAFHFTRRITVSLLFNQDLDDTMSLFPGHARWILEAKAPGID